MRIITMRELASARNEASINKPPTNESSISPMQQQAVEAWQAIGDLPKNQQAQMNGRQNQTDGSLTFDLIYRDNDSVTHCRGYSDSNVDSISCVTKNRSDKPERNDKPHPGDNDKSLSNNTADHLQPPLNRNPLPTPAFRANRREPDPQTINESLVGEIEYKQQPYVIRDGHPR